ncbi:unnamed protein product [Paramecium sonneborni]|uniref:ZZ-type domain-containing protein n=1 Tax=Paramecium sonneborni TaxID=65129 RepID=A0A8S1Q1D9_9CILI|nr:unnamed protein product [Paramecium sonneborni]
MQHLKLSIPSLNQSFLYSGNFKEMSYQQLISYAENRLGRVLYPEFQLLSINSEGVQLIIDSDQQLKILQGQNQQVIKIILKEKENETIVHPNTICSQCHSTPIINARYKCIVCENLEFCEKCLGHGQVHPLLILSKPEHEEYFDGFFKTSINKVKNLFNCQYNFKEALLKKKQVLFGYDKQNQQQKQINQEQRQLQQNIQDKEIIEDLHSKTLKLSEIFKLSPDKFDKFVKQNQHLSFEELVDLASEQIL